MKKQDDYVAGSHHYWTHFWCSLIFGAGLGAWIGWWLFNGTLGLILTAIGASIVLAYSCGRWGDRTCQWVIERLPWIT